MPYNRNAGKRWTAADYKLLRNLWNQRMAVRAIGLRLGRSVYSIREALMRNKTRVRTYYVQMPATGWVELKRKFKTECCDCGLVHVWELQEKKKGYFGFKIVRDNRATAQRRWVAGKPNTPLWTRIRKAIQPYIVRRPHGGCQVLFPLTELDRIIER